MALLEAMVAGCIPIVSDVGSIGKVIENGENGFLIKTRDVSQIVERLKYLLSDQTDWGNLRKNAKKTIAERFDLKDYIKKLEHIYREMSLKYQGFKWRQEQYLQKKNPPIIIV